MSLESFKINSLIIPMDKTYQDNGMFRAYGLVYNLLLNGIEVRWIIKEYKNFDEVDFTASATDIQTGTAINNYGYSGGPFIIDSTYSAAARPLILAWQSINPNVKVHVATADFVANVVSKMKRAPMIAVESVNSGIMTNYLNIAGIVDSNGNSWTKDSPGIITEEEIAQGALFGYSLDNCRRHSYDIFLSPHTGSSTWDDPGLAEELRDYLYQGGVLHGTCESVISIENSNAGPFLTETGIPTTDTNKGDSGSFVVNKAYLPSNQGVSTAKIQGLPGGSFQSVYHLTSGLLYNTQTTVLSHFTTNGKQYDFMMIGPSNNGTGAGKVIYEGGHNYSPSLPYSNNMENLYYRFLLNSIFFSVTKALMFLYINPTTLTQKIDNKITFDVVNSGASDAINTSFSVKLADGVIYNNDATIAPSSIVGQTLNWNSTVLGQVKPGIVLTFTANYKTFNVGPVKIADFSTTFSDEFEESYNFNYCVGAEVIENPINIADVAVRKVPTVDTIVAGNNIAYAIEVINLGPDTAENVILSDVIPAEIQSPEFSIDEGVTWNPWINPYVIGSLSNGESRIILIRGTVDPKALGEIENIANVSTTTEDPNISNNSDNAITNVIAVVDLSIEKINNINPVIVGDMISYTIMVTNAGPSVAENVVVTDVVPSSIINPEYSLDKAVSWKPWTGSYVIGTMDPNKSVEGLIRGVVDVNSGEVIKNTASVTTSTEETDLTNNSSTVETNILVYADISVFKTANPSPVVAGEMIVYDLVISNKGPAIAKNVVLSDAIPPEIKNPEYSEDNGVTWKPWVNPYVVGDLAVNESRIIKIRGTVDPATTNQIENIAIVSSDTTDPILDDNSSTNNVDVKAIADVEIKKVASAEVVKPGEMLSYDITVTNNGPSDAENVIVNDVVPAELLNPEFSINNGVSWSPWINPYIIGTVKVGQIIIIKIRGIVSSLATGTIRNIAVVTSSTEDSDLTNNSAEDSTGINAAADIAVVKKATPQVVLPGGTLTYTMIVSNNGPDVAQNVVVNDTPPSELSNVEFSIDNGLTWSPWVTPYIIGTLNPNQSVTILLRGTVNQGVLGPIINSVNITTDTPDLDLTNNSDRVITAVNFSADVAVVKTATPSTVVAGEQLTYTIKVTNNGPNIAKDVTLTDNITAEITSPEISNNNGLTWTPFISPYIIGDMQPFEVITLLIRGNVKSSATGEIDNIAIVSSSTTDLNPDNNQSSVKTPVVELTDVAVSKSVDKSEAMPGEQLIYTIIITNNGPSDAKNVTATDQLPTELNNVQYSLNMGLTWVSWINSYNFGTLVAGQSKTVLMRGTIDSLASGEVINTVIVTTSSTDTDSTNNSDNAITTLKTADISIVKTASPETVNEGELIVYTLLITNKGVVDATNVIVTDTLSPAIVDEEFSVDLGVNWQIWTGSYNIGTVMVNETKTMLIRGRVNLDTGLTTMENTATANSDVPDPNPEDNSDSVEVNISREADVIVSKFLEGEEAIAGEMVIYRIIVTNEGPSKAKNVVVTDIVPSEILSPEYSVNNGVSWNVWTGSYLVGDLLPSQSKSGLIRGKLSSSATGTIINTATVSSDTKDPNEDNNSSTDREPIKEIADISVVKTGKPNPANAGELVTYSIVVTNNGPSDAKNVILQDEVPSEVKNPEYSDDGTSWNPWTGSYNFGTLKPLEKRILLIRGIVSESATGILINTAIVDSPVEDPNNDDNQSEVILPIISRADLKVTKNSEYESYIVGEIVSYSIVIENLGPAEAVSVTLTDEVVEGISNPEVSDNGGVSYEPWVSPYDVGNLAPTEVKVILIRGVLTDKAIGTVSNKAIVSSETEDINPDNNESISDINVYNPELTLTKSVNKTYVVVGEIVTFTVIAENTGNIEIGNVELAPIYIYDLLNPSLAFVEGSVTVNGEPKPNASIISGGNIGSLDVGEKAVITFDAKVISADITPITNIVTGDFGYDIPGREPGTGSSESNEVDLIPYNPSLELDKAADKEFVVLGDILNYTVTITNNGDIDAKDVIFKDDLPDEVEFIEGSFSVDNIIINSANVEEGVNIGDIKKTQQKVVRYKVKVIDTNCKGTIINEAKIDFVYILPDGTVLDSSLLDSTTATSIVKTGISNFKQLSIDEDLDLINCFSYIEEILKIKGEISIIKSHVIKAPNITSNEGQALTGKKLIIRAVLELTVEYVVLGTEQMVQAASFKIPFTTFIMLQNKEKSFCLKEVKGEVEQVYFKLLNKKLFVNATILMKAII